jgi:type 1 glutamine amidotransferase
VTENLRAVIFTGADRYDGKWHDHAATSQRIAEILGQIGIDSRIRGTRPRTFGSLDGVDLVVLNAARGVPGPEDATDDEWAPAWATFRDYVARGGPLLVIHLALAAFGTRPEWIARIGGAWVEGTSMHPPIGDNRIHVRADAHPIVAGLTDFDVHDEMYSYLTLDPAAVVLATHHYDERDHPLAWAVDGGNGRVVYDALGHDVGAYDSAGRIRLLKREALWLTGARGMHWSGSDRRGTLMAVDETGTHPLPKTSAPAMRALNGAGYFTLEDLTKATEAELATLHGMGPKALGIIKTAMAEHGLAFAGL